MRVALANLSPSFKGSIHPGRRDPHLPLEPGCPSVEAGTESRAADRLSHARFSFPSAQAKLIRAMGEEAVVATAWREKLQRGCTWEPAHTHCLVQFGRASNIQEERPLALAESGAACLR